MGHDGLGVPAPRGAVPLDQAAQALSARGLFGVGNVIVDRTQETGFTCVGPYMLEPGWDRLATLRDTFGWTFVSASTSYRDMTQLTPQQQRDESCGSLPAFESHGHTCAWVCSPTRTIDPRSRSRPMSSRRASPSAGSTGRWRTLERQLRGSLTTKGQRWDCTSSDWRLHWTSKQEMYCYNDFLAAMDAVPSTVTPADPATVATAWGRTV